MLFYGFYFIEIEQEFELQRCSKVERSIIFAATVDRMPILLIS
jgi:hypothetical protein